MRALRKKNCSFISPSMFVSPRPSKCAVLDIYIMLKVLHKKFIFLLLLVLIRYLHLPKNELDCGDAVYLADIFVKQQLLVSIGQSLRYFHMYG